MAFGSFDNKSSGSVMSEINMVPLIDVMLVLLVIFIVTAPLLTHSVKLDLPQVSAHENQLKPEKVEFAIDAAGTRYWNGEVVTREQAIERFKIEGARPEAQRPEVHLRADQAVPYRFVAETLADASKAGLTKIGFISEPEDR
ncbi:ExbD/TolR family protein [Caldimonas manganoxidans]|uniref:ExbD/TolR family protein n=1 Tax=Caldimonas manganoxidans TaxID=196015 RepID=UPI0003710BAA|nr:biopolymer transporter ExbD [Caldimonas manganoxidans]